MANQLDLEEQEQLDQIKHFWKQYGNLITWILIAILGVYASWNGYQYWQRSQAAQAAAMFDEVQRLSGEGDLSKVDRAFKEMQDRFGSTTFAQQSGLLVAKLYEEGGKPVEAKAALSWVAEKASDAGYQAIARLRLAAILAQGKEYPKAMELLAGSFPPEFQPLVADRKGDVLMLQDKPMEARAEYEKAYKGLDERNDYRGLVEIKLTALGASPKTASGSAAPGAQVVGAEGKK
jgi:predicted negative regulator of RcsB-dependent stress response